MKKNLKCTLIFIMLMLITNCSKDDDSSTENILKWVSYNIDGFDFLITNQGDKITAYQYAFPASSPPNNHSIIYANDKLEKIDNNEFSYNTTGLNTLITGNSFNTIIEYNDDDNIIKTTTINSNQTIVLNLTYTSGLVTRIYEIIDTNTGAHYEYQYVIDYNAQKNIIEVKTSYRSDTLSDFTLRVIDTFTYDDKNNPYKNLLLKKMGFSDWNMTSEGNLHGFNSVKFGNSINANLGWISNNNLLTHQTENVNGTITLSVINYNYDNYSYNNMSYPISREKNIHHSLYGDRPTEYYTFTYN